MFIDGPWEALMFNTYTWGVGGPEEGPYVFRNIVRKLFRNIIRNIFRNIFRNNFPSMF